MEIIKVNKLINLYDVIQCVIDFLYDLLRMKVSIIVIVNEMDYVGFLFVIFYFNVWVVYGFWAFWNFYKFIMDLLYLITLINTIFCIFNVGIC